MTWGWCVMKGASALASVGASRLRGWGPRDEGFCWLEMLRGMAQN